MSTNDSDDSPSAEDYLGRWSEAMRNEEFAKALSILDEGLQSSARKNNAEEITQYVNLKKYTNDIVKTLSSPRESNSVTVRCSMCGKSEADGCILVAGANVIICDECIKICLRVLDTQRRKMGREFECSFCGKKQFEVSRIIAGPGVSICDNCCNTCAEILARDSE